MGCGPHGSAMGRSRGLGGGVGFRRRVRVGACVVGGRSCAGWFWPATACEGVHGVARARRSGVGGSHADACVCVRYSVCCAPLPVCVRGVACGVAPGARWMLRARSYVVWARSRGVAPRQESVRSHTPPLRRVTCGAKVPLALASTAFLTCDPRSTFPHHRHDTRRGPSRTDSAPPRHERVPLLVTGCAFGMKPLLAFASISLSISVFMSEVAPDKR